MVESALGEIPKSKIAGRQDGQRPEGTRHIEKRRMFLLIIIRIHSKTCINKINSRT